MFSTSITKGDFVTFFISAKNSVLILWNEDNETDKVIAADMTIAAGGGT